MGDNMKLPQGIKRQSNYNESNNTSKKEKNIEKANKGVGLEQMINNSNLYYLDNEIAVIHKKPTPVQIVNVDFPSRNKAVITEAYYKLPSTTDYNGIYKGYYIDFDAKECQSLTSFPLSNVHPHQFKHLKAIKKQGGIGFFIVSFNSYEEYYLLEIDQYMLFYESSLNGDRKSIPYSFFKENCIEVYPSYMPELEYLKGVDILIKNQKKKN